MPGEIANIELILEANRLRNADLDELYDPMLGTGSKIPRKNITYSDLGTEINMDLPETMFNEPLIILLAKIGDLQKTIHYLYKTISPEIENQLRNELVQLRLTHDFEFHCITCVKIPDKQSENLIPFKLNRPQRRLVAIFEHMRLNGIPIRVIIGKARQWGGSTVSQIYENWIQLRHRKRWNMAICTAVNPQAAHIRNMFERTIENYPPELGKYTMGNYAGFANNKYLEERDCIIGIGSSEKPDNLRTYNIHLAHFSEVSTWNSTPKKSAKELAQSLRGTIPFKPYTMVVMESTAKGVGNFFYNEYQSAKKGESGYEAVFIPWFEIEMYREPIDDMDSFIRSLDESYAADGSTFWYLWELGATLEGINWYKTKKKSENLDDLMMFQEFPSTDVEMFSSTGRPAFNPFYIKRAEKTCIDPIYKGELSASTVKGKQAFDKIEFQKSIGGNLWIWELPDRAAKVSNRYCGFADIGGVNKLADFSVLKVFDRYWMIDGGVPEVCAVWHGHIDQDLFAWKCAQIMWWYHKGLLAIETNSLKTDNDLSEGEHFLTVLDEIVAFYPNLYSRSNPEQVRRGMQQQWGFHTNRKTKPKLVDAQNAAMRDGTYMERDKRATNEMYTFELKDNGTYGAMEGLHDDHVIVTAGCNWLSGKYMPVPVEIKETTIRHQPIISQATI